MMNLFTPSMNVMDVAVSILDITTHMHDVHFTPTTLVITKTNFIENHNSLLFRFVPYRHDIFI